MKVAILALLFVAVLSVLIEAKLSNKVRKGFVKALNKYRSKVAKGKAPNGTSGGKLPKASNMYQVTWSKKLEKKAAKLVKLCNFTTASSTSGLAAYRQNGTVKAAAIIKATPKGWWTAFQKYGIPSLTFNNNDTTYRNITSVEDYVHLLSFVQGIWAKSKEVGCAAATCTNLTYNYCIFKPGGTNGQAIYKKGKKLKCPKGSKKVKKSGLCKVKGKKGKTIHK
ncbi:Venom allergen antigen 5-like protein [Aphelenchoides bicaudatus]|nr:Venom allergen antigen 5-like protein [Aphelenchoides bicaudatus]